MTKQLSWRCDNCGEPVQTGNGGTPPGLHVEISLHTEDTSSKPLYEPQDRLFRVSREADVCSKECLIQWTMEAYE